MKKRIIATLLTAIMAFGAFAGCMQEPKSESSSGSEVTNTQTVKKYTYNGTHIFTAPEREDYIVQNGHTEYVIVLPSKQDSYTSFAHAELTSLFKQATGITLPYVVEDETGLAHSTTAKYISIGNTKMFANANLKLDTNLLKEQGVRIKTVDNTIYLNGGVDGGVLYAVYDLMQILFHFEVYFEDCWEIDENVKNLKMRNFDVTDVPDIKNRANFALSVSRNVNNIKYRFRMPMNMNADIIPLGDKENGENAYGIHNSFAIISKKNPNYDANWIADSGQQLCYTAHGDATSYENMVNLSAKIIQEGLIAYNPTNYPNSRYATFTMEDNPQNCTCSACATAKQKYGANSGAIIVFLNDVMEKVDAWMQLEENAPYKRDDFKLFFFAYQCYEDAPVFYDESTGKYVLSHEDVVPRDDVGVYLATMPGVQYASNFYDEINDKFRRLCSQWFDVTEGIYFWTYNANFRSYLGYASNAVFGSDFYQYVATGPILTWGNQFASNSYASSFQEIKPYLDYKLMWDSSLDQSQLIEKYFNAMYKEAAPVMKELYMQMQAQHLSIMQKKELYDRIYETYFMQMKNVEFWPLQLCKTWLALFEKAHEIIKEKYASSDVETYELVKSHIDREYIGTAYYYLLLHKDDEVDASHYEKVRTYFKTELAKLPLDRFKTGEGGGTLADWVKTI